MGRPSKLTPEIQERFVEAVRLGATYEMAANYAGIGISTFTEWMRYASEGIEPYSTFSAALQQAEGAAVVKWLGVIERAQIQDRHWTAAAWKLERKYPKAFGRTPPPDIAPTSSTETDLVDRDDVIRALREKIPADILAEAARKPDDE